LAKGVQGVTHLGRHAVIKGFAIDEDPKVGLI
jgi:hypothetical protein